MGRTEHNDQEKNDEIDEVEKEEKSFASAIHEALENNFESLHVVLH